MSLAATSQPTSASTQPISARACFAGLDVGNGAVKLVIDGQEKRIPSYYQPIHGQFYDAPSEGGFVEYLEGDRSDLMGARWLVGAEAYRRNPAGYLRVTDDRQGKIAYCLQMLMGALSYYHSRQTWDLNVVASVHLEKAMGEPLAQNLQGTHVVRFGNNKTYVRINVLKTLEEGAGAIVSCASEVKLDGQTLIYDFGNGTIAISLFGQRGRLVEREVKPGGVQALIDAIAKNPDTIRTLYQEGDRHVIRQAIEAQTFTYPTDTRAPWNFEPVYRAELSPWVGKVLKSALAFGSKWVATSDSVVAIGGGVQLPLVAELLQRQGITPVADPTWANARGLQRLAVMLGGRSNG